MYKKILVIVLSAGVLLFWGFYPFVCPANPETVIFKSAVVWRVDNKGDYGLDKNTSSSSGTYEINSAHTTRGNIEVITAAWDFSGKVDLEVSTDNGLNYTPAVNGMPLEAKKLGTAGFVKGNKIRWKAVIYPESELKEVKITYRDSFGTIGTFGQPQLSGFKFRKVIYIKGSGSAELFHYQMKIRVGERYKSQKADVYCQGKIEADFKDVRFTCADGETLLPYYLESITGKEPNRIAVFWVNIPQISPESLHIYIYYGNSKAGSLSKGEGVFDFFDDFKKGELDLKKWKVFTKLGGNYNVINSRLKLSSAKVLSMDYRIKDGIIEYQTEVVILPDKEISLRTQAGYENRLIVRGEEKITVTESHTQVVSSSTYKGAEHCIAVGDIVKVNNAQPVLPGSRYNYRIIAKGENLNFERYSLLPLLEASVSFKDSGGLTSGYIGLEAASGNVSYYNWIRVRKYIDSGPVIDTLHSSPEEEANLPAFINVALAENGNLVLEYKHNEGSYISSEIASSFPVRIIAPGWIDEGRRTRDEGRIEVDISADGGVNYKVNSENNAYYYASKKDFAVGNKLRCRVRFFQNKAQAINQETEAFSFQLKEMSLGYHPGKIFLITPNGGEVWKAGTYEKILWFASGHESLYPMRIEYSLDGGSAYNVIEKRKENIGVYFWKVPEEFSDKIIIKVSDAWDGSIYDVSSAVLAITP